MIHFACPRCGTAYNEPEDAGGRKFFCSHAACGQKIQVPDSLGSQTMGGIPLPKQRGSSTPSGTWYYEQNGEQQGPAFIPSIVPPTSGSRMRARDGGRRE